MSNLLISEPPLQVLPSLANELKSSDKAIIIQQVHYWLNKSTNIRNGNKWIYNSASDWQKQFPWLSEKTVQRYLKDLENRGLLITGNYNKAKFDRTKWYRIDYDALDNLGRALGPTVPTIGTDSTNPKGPAVPTNTNRLPETTTENTKEYSASKTNGPSLTQLKSDFEEIWADYPNKQGKGNAFNHYKAWRKKSKEHTNSYLIERLKSYKIYCQQNRWYRPMNGSTWFNGRFDDELEIHGTDQEQRPTTKEDLFRQ